MTTQHGGYPPGCSGPPDDHNSLDALCEEIGETFDAVDRVHPSAVLDLVGEPSPVFPGAIDWSLDLKLRGVARGVAHPGDVDEACLRALENLLHTLRIQKRGLRVKK